MRPGTTQVNGERVKKLRSEKGLTQESLAQLAGCSKKTIENIERGKPAILRTVREVAKVLGTTPGHILMVSASVIDGECNDGELPIENDSTDSTDNHNSNIAVSVDSISLELVIDRKFESYSPEEQQQLLRALKAMLSIMGDIKVTQKRPGSVRPHA